MGPRYGLCDFVADWSEYRRQPPCNWYQEWGQFCEKRPKTMSSEVECLEIMEGDGREGNVGKTGKTHCSLRLEGRVMKGYR